MAGETSLNNQRRAARRQLCIRRHGVVRKNFTFADQGDGEIVHRRAAAGRRASATGSGIWVKTLFNGTTPRSSIGVAGTPALFLAATASTAVGGTSLGALLIAAAAVPTHRHATSSRWSVAPAPPPARSM